MQRRMAIRLLALFGWFVLAYIFSSILIGGIVGAGAALGLSGHDAAHASGYEAGVEFSQNYGLFVYVGQISVVSLLAFLGMLPGTSKYKKNKST